MGFALVSQGYDGKEGYLKIQGLEGSKPVAFCFIHTIFFLILFVGQISIDFQEVHQKVRVMLGR